MPGFCKVCKDSGKPESLWRSHNVRGRGGKPTCPTLAALKCSYCQKTGHTPKYCNSRQERELRLGVQPHQPYRGRGTVRPRQQQPRQQQPQSRQQPSIRMGFGVLSIDDPNDDSSSSSSCDDSSDDGDDSSDDGDELWQMPTGNMSSWASDSD